MCHRSSQAFQATGYRARLELGAQGKGEYQADDSRAPLSRGAAWRELAIGIVVRSFDRDNLERIIRLRELWQSTARDSPEEPSRQSPCSAPTPLARAGLSTRAVMKPLNDSGRAGQRNLPARITVSADS